MAIVVSVFSVSVGERLYYPCSAVAWRRPALRLSFPQGKENAGPVHVVQARAATSGHLYTEFNALNGVLKVTQCAGSEVD